MKLFQTVCKTFADWERWVSDSRLYEYDQLTIFVSSLSPSFRMQVERYVQHHLPQAQLFPMIGDASEHATFVPSFLTIIEQIWTRCVKK